MLTTLNSGPGSDAGLTRTAEGSRHGQGIFKWYFNRVSGVGGGIDMVLSSDRQTIVQIIH